MTELQKAFLTRLASMKQGRVAYTPEEYDTLIPHIQRLVEDEYIRHRGFGFSGGFQITDKGRAYVGGEA